MPDPASPRQPAPDTVAVLACTSLRQLSEWRRAEVAPDGPGRPLILEAIDLQRARVEERGRSSAPAAPVVALDGGDRLPPGRPLSEAVDRLIRAVEDVRRLGGRVSIRLDL